MRKVIFIVTGLLFLTETYLKADGVTFKASAPNAVVMGQLTSSAPIPQPPILATSFRYPLVF